VRAGPLGSHEYLMPALQRVITRALPAPGARILDLGCGNGYVSSRLRGLGHVVIGVDASAEAVSVAQSAHPAMCFEVASLEDDDLATRVGEGFDCVVSLEVIEHLYRPCRLFEQSRRVLRRGGWLVLSTPYHGYAKNLALSVLGRWDRHFAVDWEGGHIKFFSRRTLTAMAEAGRFVPERWIGVGRLPGLWKSMMLVATRGDEGSGHWQ
jgi:SAM-dependent methyltransferase